MLQGSFVALICIAGGSFSCTKLLKKMMCDLWALKVSIRYSWGNVPYLVQSALFFEGFLNLKDVEFGLFIYIYICNMECEKPFALKTLTLVDLAYSFQEFSSNWKFQGC